MTLRSDAMLKCVYREDVRGIQNLLVSRGSPDAQDKDGRTAVVHAVLASPTSMQVISTLLEAGVDTNIKDCGQGWSTLALTARDCAAKICRMHIHAGAEVDYSDAFWNTALWRAIIAKKADTVAVWLAGGANPELFNKSGVSPRILSKTLGWDLMSVS